MKSHSLFGIVLVLNILVVCRARALNEKDAAAKTGIVPFINGRIIGGHRVDISLHPHQISLRIKNILQPQTTYSLGCGGSIITDRIVLTAAHCIIGKVASQIQIVAGANYRRSADGVVLPVQELLMHENYNVVNFNNDIALVVLAAPMPINNYTIKAIELAEEPVKKGATATITGWGTISNQGDSPDFLQEVKVPVVSNEECNSDYNGSITDEMFCAGLRGVGGKDACHNDSGGPVLVNGKLAGIVSWGIGCADAKYPGVYANVPHLRPWLCEKITQIESKLLLENLA